jgi:ABC-2 type transport system permease protein
MTGVWRLTRLYARTNWALLVGPALVLAGLVIATAKGVKDLYPTDAARAVYAATMGASPAGWAFNGRAADVTTIGGIAAFEVGFMGQLAIPAIGLLLGIGLSRRQEESGVIELVTAGRVSRTAVPLAALLAATGSWLLFAKATEAGLYALGFDRLGCQTYPAILTMYGLAFTTIGLLAAELAQGERGAYALGGVVALAGFVTRMYVDGRGLRYPWTSPMGWVAEAHPWGTWVWWPALSFLGLIAASGAAAVIIASRRDLGAGVLPQRAGRASAMPGLATPLGVAWRLSRGSMAGWAIGSVVWCASMGSLSQEMDRLIAKNPTLSEALGGTSDIETVMALVLAGVLASAAAVSGISRLGAEESDARLGLVLAGSVSRWQVWLAWVAVVATAAVGTLLASGLALGVAEWLVGDPRSVVGTDLRAAVAYAPGVLLVVAIAAVLVAIAPQLRGLAWLPVAWTAAVGLFGEPLRLPQWSRDLSPFELVGRVPVESLDRTAWMWLLAVAVMAIAVTTVRFGTRSLVRG